MLLDSLLKSIIWNQDSFYYVYQLQLQEKHNESGSPSSWGVQLRKKYSKQPLTVNVYWNSSHIIGKEWLYYWDVNLPGEMRSKVFIRSGHYLGSSIAYQTHELSKIYLRVTAVWNSWDFDAIPSVRGAIQINVSF